MKIDTHAFARQRKQLMETMVRRHNNLMMGEKVRSSRLDAPKPGNEVFQHIFALQKKISDGVKYVPGVKERLSREVVTWSSDFPDIYLLHIMRFDHGLDSTTTDDENNGSTMTVKRVSSHMDEVATNLDDDDGAKKRRTNETQRDDDEASLASEDADDSSLIDDDPGRGSLGNPTALHLTWYSTGDGYLIERQQPSMEQFIIYAEILANNMTKIRDGGDDFQSCPVGELWAINRSLYQVFTLQKCIHDHLSNDKPNSEMLRFLAGSFSGIKNAGEKTYYRECKPRVDQYLAHLHYCLVAADSPGYHKPTPFAVMLPRHDDINLDIGLVLVRRLVEAERSSIIFMEAWGAVRKSERDGLRTEVE